MNPQLSPPRHTHHYIPGPHGKVAVCRCGRFKFLGPGHSIVAVGYADKTDYARRQGYTGRHRVYVSDGKVISHGHADWFQWLGHVRLRGK